MVGAAIDERCAVELVIAELLEVFYAHTVSPVCIAFITESIMCLYIGSFHFTLGLLAFTAFFTVGVLVPLIVSRRSGSLYGDILKKVIYTFTMQASFSSAATVRLISQLISGT